MSIELRPEDALYVKECIESGAYRTEQEVIGEALFIMRRSTLTGGDDIRAEIDALIEEGERDFENGDFVEWTPAHMEEIKAKMHAIHMAPSSK
jgi:Arc/MetJ-type ribon-helix-helix transcriptional regulator